jgi:hypothetical protein
MSKVLVIACMLAVAAVLVSQASAGTSNVSVSMSFTEPILQDIHSGCPVLQDGFCGSGVVVPFGHATESIVFGGACGGFCDFRTVNVAGGSIYLDEFFSDPTCPGACHPNRAEPGGGTLTDIVVGGTGMFANASGIVSGRVWAAGPQSAIKLAGTITLQT